MTFMSKQNEKNIVDDNIDKLFSHPSKEELLLREDMWFKLRRIQKKGFKLLTHENSTLEEMKQDWERIMILRGDIPKC